MGEKHDQQEICNKKAKKLLILWSCRAHKAAKAHYRQATALKNANSVSTTINAVSSIFVLFFTNATWARRYMRDGAEGKATISTDTLEIPHTDEGAPLETFTFNVSLDLPNETTASAFIIAASLVAVILVASTIIQYIYRWGEKAGKHQAAGNEFSNVQRKIERYLTLEDYTMSLIHNVSRDYNHITKSYPLTNEKIWRKAGEGDLAKKIEALEKWAREEFS